MALCQRRNCYGQLETPRSRNLRDPKLVLMDLRPPEAYSNGHIPGARSFDIFGISLIDTRPQALEAFLWIIEHLIQAKGVNSDSNVVIYDDVAGMRSARFFGSWNSSGTRMCMF